MIDHVKSKECCLCGNCELVCPTQAITFRKKRIIFIIQTLILKDVLDVINVKKCVQF